MIVLPNVSALEMLSKVLKDEDIILKLYQNNYIPNAHSVLSSFDEADFDGYTQITLTKTNWTAPVVEIFSCSGYSGFSGYSGYEAVSAYGVSGYSGNGVSWICGIHGNTIYGYYMVGYTSNKLLWVDSLSVPRVLTQNTVLSITPTLQLKTLKFCYAH